MSAKNLKINTELFLGLSMLLLFLLSCREDQKEAVDLSGIEAHVELVRFEQKFYTSKPGDLSKLKSEFPYLFPSSEPDSVWNNKIEDEDELFLFQAVQKEFDHLETEKLRSLFRHVKYYYPRFEEPKIITVLSNVDYENKVIFADSLLFISLDTYLGENHEVYEGYPMYIKQNFTREQLPVDVAGSIADQILRPNNGQSFVSKMIQEGKRLKLIESFLPDTDKNEVIGFRPDQMKWAETSESDIWRYFIQNEMLYSNKSDLNDRFIEPAPFSKFYLEVDQDSPGRIGAWFGWQIVNAFLSNNQISLQEMINLDNEELFKRSRYKPRKN